MKRIFAGAVLLAASVGAQAAVITFDDNALAPNTFYNPGAATTWTSGGANFDHLWNAEYNCCWGNFTYSNQTDTTTPGFTNDRAAITGDGVGAGQDNYAIGYTGTTGSSVLTFNNAQTVLGGYFTNTTYAYLAMANGDDGNGIPSPFIKGPFGEGDFFKLTVTGLDEFGGALGSLDFLMADGANVIDTWEWFDLSGLGEVNGLSFSLSSSDNGSFGMNTPAYFAVDNLTIVPVPAAVWLFASALGLLGLRRKVRK